MTFSRQGRELAICVFLFLLTFAVFWVSPNLQVGDSKYSMLLSESILSRHSVFLEGYQLHEVKVTTHDFTLASAIATRKFGYQLGLVHGHLLYIYPHGSSFLSLPFVALANLFGCHIATADGSYSQHGEIITEKTLAAFLMAVLTVVIFRSALLLLGVGESAFIALACAFGTQVFSSASRAMWSSTWLILLAQIAILELLDSALHKRTPRPILLATILSWMYFCRPTASIPIAVLTIYIFWFHRRSFIAYAATGALWALAFVTYSHYVFGKWVPGYYALGGTLTFHGFPVALAGILISPSRGMFIYVPVVAFVLYRVVRYWSWLPERALATAALVIVALLVFSTAAFPVWWGGWSYGPRYSTDTVPWLVLPAILGLAANPPYPARRLSRIEAAFGCALVALSIAMNAPGALSYKAARWNAVVDIDNHPERAFDWSYPQFLAGFVSAPNGWRDPGS